MPTYTFFDTQAGVEYDDFMSISEKEDYLKKNPHIEQLLDAPAMVHDHVMGVGPKNDEGFKDVMRGIASKHPDSPMADKYGSGKSTKRLQAENIFNKHRNRK